MEKILQIIYYLLLLLELFIGNVGVCENTYYSKDIIYSVVFDSEKILLYWKWPLKTWCVVVGFLRQLIVMSGIKDVLKFIKPKGAKIGKIKWNPDFKDDIQTLLETVEGAMNLGKGLGKIKHPFKSNKIAMYAAAMKTTDNEKV